MPYDRKGSMFQLIIGCIIFSAVLQMGYLQQCSPLPPATPEQSDFNFNKKDYLKVKVKQLVECILSDTPAPVPLKKDIGPNGKERVIFQYNGSRDYQESCLGDAHKNDLILRLYDGHAANYTEKIEFLNSFSCDAIQHLECRKVGDEPNRTYAMPNIPVMKCLCPNYNKAQTFLDNATGYYDPTRRICVLKVGQVCTVNPQGHDKRLLWNDFDYVDPGTNATGIDVVDLRPIPLTQTCVKNAFCYTNDTKGLPLHDANKNRCVCDAGFYPHTDGECHFGREPTSPQGAFLAFIMFTIGLTAFLGGLLPY